MEHLPVVDRCYQKWWELQCKVNDYYSEKERQRPPLSEQKEFRAIKNAVIQEAEHVRLNHISFEDRDMEDYGDWVNERSLTWTCRELWRLVENEALPLEDRDEAAERLELLAKMGDPYAQTFATHALTSGVDAKTLSGILGHTKASFTLDTYTHVTGDMQRGAAEIVGGFLTELLGEELEPWQRNENGEMAVST